MSTFEWYIPRLVVKTKCKDMCYDESKLCAQNVDTVLGSLVNTNVRLNLCDCSKRKKILTLTSNKTFVSQL